MTSQECHCLLPGQAGSIQTPVKAHRADGKKVQHLLPSAPTQKCRGLCSADLLKSSHLHFGSKAEFLNLGTIDIYWQKILSTVLPKSLCCILAHPNLLIAFRMETLPASTH